VPRRALDLGSGGGVPGLILAQRWPATSWTFLDANDRRCRFLGEAITALELGDRAAVVQGRAEEVGRGDDQRGSYDLVTARSFGPPATTAECAAPFLAVGGRLLVSEPPDGPPRWPVEVEQLGLRVVERVGGIQVLEQASLCPDRFPRRTGVPLKRPLF
jgi:16S rRNA (guanine527-N7)-methyltransferase